MGSALPRKIPCSLWHTDKYYAVDTDLKVYTHGFKRQQLDRWDYYSEGLVTQIEHGEFYNGKRYLVGLGTDKCIYMGMYQTSNEYKSWRKLTGDFNVTMFYLEGETLYGLGEEDGAIYMCTIYKPTEKDCYASNWNPVTKGGVSSFTLYGGTLYAVKDNQVWTCTKTSGGEWSRKTQGQTGITQVEVTHNTIYGLGLDTKIYDWFAGRWRPLTPKGATKFVLSASYIHVLLEDARIWKAPRVEGTDKWQYVTGPGPRIINIARPFGANESKM